jgi:hypothetical protein
MTLIYVYESYGNDLICMLRVVYGRVMGMKDYWPWLEFGK